MEGKMQEEKVIIVDHLTKDYGHGRGVFDVNFVVHRGEVFGFLGPNGAGKSTTIRHIMGFSRPQSGQTLVEGLESFKNYHKILGNVGYLPGEIALPEGLTGWEFIQMMSDLRHCSDRKMLDFLLEKFELNPAGETKKMSLGDKRKLAIIAAFMSDPDILVLDEPTSGLDPVMQQVFIEFIKSEKKRGKTILLSSHMFNEVEATCDRIAIIKDGRIVSTFVTNDIKHNQNKNFKVQFKNSSSYKEFVKLLPKKRKDDVTVKKPSIAETNDEQLWAIVAINDGFVDKFIEILEKFEVAKFEEIKFTIEDYFMQFYHEDKKFGGVL